MAIKATILFMSLFGLLTMSCTNEVKETKPTAVTENKSSMKSIYTININSLDNEAIDLSQFKGKKILFVNVASKCGYTPQYKDLQQLHETYKDQLAIIGIPCNQFGGQEPGSDEEIVAFCQKNYGVSFLMTEKVDTKGVNQHELYKWLTSKEMNGNMDSEVKWNFQKYLVNASGELEAMFLSSVNPMDEQITSLLH